MYISAKLFHQVISLLRFINKSKVHMLLPNKVGLTEGWRSVTTALFKHPAFATYNIVAGETTQQTFLKMLTEFTTVHYREDGYETHLELTPYEQVMDRLYKDRKREMDKSLEEAEKKSRINSGKKHFTSQVLGSSLEGKSPGSISCKRYKKLSSM